MVDSAVGVGCALVGSAVGVGCAVVGSAVGVGCAVVDSVAGVGCAVVGVGTSSTKPFRSSRVLVMLFSCNLISSQILSLGKGVVGDVGGAVVGDGGAAVDDAGGAVVGVVGGGASVVEAPVSKGKGAAIILDDF